MLCTSKTDAILTDSDIFHLHSELLLIFEEEKNIEFS